MLPASLKSSQLLLFALFAVATLAIAFGLYAANIEPLLVLFVRANGIFENVTAFFYAATFLFGVNAVLINRQNGVMQWAPALFLTIIAFVFLGEEFRWGLPYILGSESPYYDWGLQKMLATMLGGAESRVTYEEMTSVTIARLVIAILLIYIIMAAIYFRKRWVKYVPKFEITERVFFALFFVVFFVSGVTLDVIGDNFRFMTWEEACEMIAAFACFLCVVSFIPQKNQEAD